MGDQDDLPFDVYRDEEELKPSILQKKRQPVEEIEEVIEDIRRLMGRSVSEEINKGKMSRRKPSREAGKKQQQQQQSSGEDG